MGRCGKSNWSKCLPPKYGNESFTCSDPVLEILVTVTTTAGTNIAVPADLELPKKKIKKKVSEMVDEGGKKVPKEVEKEVEEAVVLSISCP